MVDVPSSNPRGLTHVSMQAEKLRSKAQRPEQSRSSQQYARYLYYLGRIRAIQLEYTDAKDCLQQAARKVGGQVLSTHPACLGWVSLGDRGGAVVFAELSSWGWLSLALAWWWWCVWWWMGGAFK